MEGKWRFRAWVTPFPGIPSYMKKSACQSFEINKTLQLQNLQEIKLKYKVLQLLGQSSSPEENGLFCRGVPETLHKTARTEVLFYSAKMTRN